MGMPSFPSARRDRHGNKDRLVAGYRQVLLKQYLALHACLLRIRKRSCPDHSKGRDDEACG
jgi:hypothetical protein